MKNKVIIQNTLLENYLLYIPILWFCFIPLGNTLRSIGIIATIISICLQKNNSKNVISFLKTPWFYILSLAILWSYISFFWTPKPNPQISFYLNKISFFWLLPFFILGFQKNKQKELAYPAFLIAMLIPLGLSALKLFSHWEFHGDVGDPGLIFYNHIITGFYASFAAFLSLELFFKDKKYYYLAAFVLFSFQILFINPGKAAYGVYLLLITYSIWHKTTWKLKTLGLIFALIGALILIKISPGVQLTLKSLSRDIQEFKSGNLDTSFGFRIQFHHFAYTLFKNHWLVGNGIGGYDYWFKMLNPVPAWPHQANTHSQYWFFASDLGLIGLILWLSFFISLVKKAKQLGWHGHIFNGYMMALALNCFTDNMLFASPINLLFILWAIAYPEKN
jgi:hypothetical protein